MKALTKAIKEKRALIFLDLEGTQISHEMIEIGAYLVTLKDDLSVKKIYPGFKSYVKAHHPIGPVVREMTHIDEALLQKDGQTFQKTMTAFRKYVGKYYGECRYVTFGSHDIRIINQSVLNNEQAAADIAHNINKFHFDYSLFLSAYVQDDNGNPLSLTNYLKVFGVAFEGRAHDALADAYNLIDLYSAVLAKPDILQKEYKKTLSHLHHLPEPIKKGLQKLNAGETLTPSMYDSLILEAVK